MLRIKLLSAAIIAVLSIGNLQAQEIEAVEAAKDVVTKTVEAAAVESLGEAEKASATSVSLDNEGNLLGKAFVAGEETPLEAKVTIANSEGVVVDSVVAQEDGSFAFTNVAPGSYNMYGATSSYIGAQTYDVVPYSGGTGCSSCDLGLTSYSEPVYETYASAPCGSCSAAPSPCGCGGGGGGGLLGGGGGLLGGGGGGLFSNRLVRLGAIGGIVAIATSGDDDDASPDE